MTCKIEGCQNPVYGHGLCAKHYFRQRRHGDTEATHKPGPKPKHPPKPKPEPQAEVRVAKGPDSSAEDALRAQLARADAEIAEFRRWKATQDQPRAQLAAAQNTNVEELQLKNRSLQYQVNKLSERLKEARTVEYARLQAIRDDLRFQNRELREQLAEAKKPRSESEEVAKLQRQIKAARTRIQTLTMDVKRVREERDAAPAVITKANYNKLRKVFHPDGEARVSQERKAELTAAFQIFNRLKFKVIGKD